MNHCKEHRLTGGSSDPLEAIVNSYLANNAQNEERYLRYYAVQPTLAEAVTKSTMAELLGGRRFSHQRRIPHSALTEAKEALLKVDFSAVPTFDELHTLVAETIGPIRSIGPLTIYDTAHRIGAHLQKHPEFVYLHADVREGAKALGLDYREAKLPMSAFPEAFQKLRPEQVEDCLCMYKKQLKALASRLRNVYES